MAEEMKNCSLLPSCYLNTSLVCLYRVFFWGDNQGLVCLFSSALSSESPSCFVALGNLGKVNDGSRLVRQHGTVTLRRLCLFSCKLCARAGAVHLPGEYPALKRRGKLLGKTIWINQLPRKTLPHLSLRALESFVGFILIVRSGLSCVPGLQSERLSVWQKVRANHTHLSGVRRFSPLSRAFPLAPQSQQLWTRAARGSLPRCHPQPRAAGVEQRKTGAASALAAGAGEV